MCIVGVSILTFTHLLTNFNILQYIFLILFITEPVGLEGCMLRIVAKTYFPSFNYDRITDDPGTLVRPKDSLNGRMIPAIATAYNFT